MAVIFNCRWAFATRVVSLAGTAFNGFKDQDIFQSQDYTMYHYHDYTEFN